MTAVGRISYKVAVAILAGSDSELVSRIDKLLGGTILASAATLGSPAPLSLIGPRDELKSLVADKVGGIVAQLRGVALPERTQRIHAAHAVLVIDSFLSSTETILGEQWKNLDLTRAELTSLFSGERSTAKDAAPLAEYVLNAGIPMPEPMTSLQSTVEQLRAFFSTVVGHLLGYLKGLELWESRPGHVQASLRNALISNLPDDAVQRYLEAFRRLAADVPEFAIWANLQEHHATTGVIREEFKNLGSMAAQFTDLHHETSRRVESLETYLGELLASLGSQYSRYQESLARVYQANVARPILGEDEQYQSQIVAPPISTVYQQPSFKLVEYASTTNIALETWWRKVDLRSDLDAFISGYLLSPRPVELPLLVLGHPGAGKSMLTEILAASLPEQAFTVVRVPLRSVAPDGSIHVQIDQALFDVLHEQVSYPQLVEAGCSLPVVLLDGFDELMQATGVRRSDYLEMIAEFQRIERSQGRPVAVIVTSRTAVVDRARTPLGATVIKLEPFSREQVASWLEVWNVCNRDLFESRGLALTTTTSVWRYSDLACQPVLLLMLAVYDSDSNELQTQSATMDSAALYEKLLAQFIRRETSKSEASVTPEQVEREIFKLAVIALGMFNRGAQVVRGDQVDADLDALGLREMIPVPADRQSFSPHLSRAELMLGQFFFVRSTLIADRVVSENQGVTPNAAWGTAGSSFEFLHATFAEYLVARTYMVLLSQVKQERPSSTPWRSTEIVYEGGFLWSVYSFQSLCVSSQVVVFLQQLAHGMFASQASSMAESLRVLLGIAPVMELAEGRYAPVPRGIIARHAYYSSNLVVCFAAIKPRFKLRDIVADGVPVEAWWNRQIHLWESGMEEEAWAAVVDNLQVDDDADNSRTIELKRSSHLDSVRLDRVIAGFLVEDADVVPDVVVSNVSDRYRFERRARSLYRWSMQDLCMETVSLLSDGVGATVAQSCVRDKRRDGDTFNGAILGATVFAGLAYSEDVAGGNAQLEGLYDLAMEAIAAARKEDSFSGWLQLLRQLDAAGDKVSLERMVRILQSALHAGPADADHVYYQRICMTAVRNIRRSRVVSPAGRAKIADELLEVATGAWAMMDMVHHVSATPAEALELMMDIEDCDVPIVRIEPGLGRVEDWLDRVSLTAIATEATPTFVRVLSMARRRRLDEWAGMHGIEALLLVSREVLDLLNPTDVIYLVACGLQYGTVGQVELLTWYFSEYGELEWEALRDGVSSWSEKSLLDGLEGMIESYRKLGSLPASPQVSGVMARVSDKTH